MNIQMDEYRRFADYLREQFGEDDDLIADMLEGETDFHEVVGRLLRAMNEARAMADANKALADHYAGRKKALTERADRLKGAVKALMNATGQRKLAHDLATLTIKHLPPKAEFSGDPADLPDDLCSIKRTASLTAIKAALEAGRDVPGARMTNGGETLQVRAA